MPWTRQDHSEVEDSVNEALGCIQDAQMGLGCAVDYLSVCHGDEANKAVLLLEEAQGLLAGMDDNLQTHLRLPEVGTAKDDGSDEG